MPSINPVRRINQPQQTESSVTVRRGDSMSAIAQRHGVSLQDLIAANPQVRDPNQIRVGQELRLPGNAAVNEDARAVASGRTYTVRSGDTMKSE